MARRAIFCSLTLFCAVLVILHSSLIHTSLVEGKGKSVCPTTLKKILGDEKSCKKLRCESHLNAKKCPKGTEFSENVASCGCCPACVRYEELKEFDECVEPNYEDCGEKVCPVVMPVCGAGLICNTDSNTCVKLDEKDTKVSASCATKLAMSRAGKLHWTPTCNPDGSYAPKQCKGEKDTIEGMCFCTDKEGQRIFGRKAWSDDTANMTCACSIHAHELRTSGQISTLHCTSDGNYEALQCDTDSGLCYCVNPKTGKLTGAVLPEKHWKDLPCYSESLGGNYLRKCDSEWAATERIRREALLHGIELSLYSKVDCDYDGSFKRYQQKGEMEECTDKSGTRILSYYRQGGADKTHMTCNCAREPSEYLAEGLNNWNKRCDVLGNFETVTENGKNAICVDSDGFEYYQAPIAYKCCLITYNEGFSGCGELLQPSCFSKDNPDGYKQCKDIIT